MINILKTNKWIELRELVDEKKGINGYVYSHEKSCDGKKIVILPYRNQKGKFEILLRDELTPCWDLNKKIISSLTGSVEKNNSPLETAIIELKEEAGYSITKEDIVELGEMFGIKSSDTVYYLFTVDLTNKEKGKATTDGSKLEKEAKCFWTDNFLKAQDPFVYAALIKMLKHFKQTNLDFKLI